MLTAKVQDLWDLVQGRPQVDPSDLADAVCAMSAHDDLDYRTRLLIRDSADALQSFWGKRRIADWLAQCRQREKILAIREEDFDRAGFPSLTERLIDKTDPADIKRFLRELGTQVVARAPLQIGGAAALILGGRLSRHTDDVDVVDEIPSEIRAEHVLLEGLRKRYGLRLAHFESRHLPSGWLERLNRFGSFGTLDVFTVGALDIFAGKLFSKRAKDLDDLRMLARGLDKAEIARRVRESTQALQADPALESQAERNWYILYGEALPK